MTILISIPILIILMILQTTVAREVTLFFGSADLILVWLAAWGLNSRDNTGYLLALFSGTMVALVSALPWYVYLGAYFSVIILARYVFKRLWQSPLLSMFAITMVSSILLYVLTITGLRLGGIEYSLQETLYSVIIPSIFLNLFLSIPIYAIVKDFSRWIYRSEEAA